MQVGQYNIEADKHAAWSKIFEIVGLSDMTGSEAALDIKANKADTTALVSLTHLSGISFTATTITISLTSEQVDSIGCSGWYDLFIKLPAGDWIKIMQGRVLVNPSVTDPTPPT